MYKHLKFLAMSILTLSLVSDISSMEQNNINTSSGIQQNTVNNQNTINNNQNNINRNEYYDENGFFIYDPYSVNSPIPTQDDLIQFMKIKELDFDDKRVQKCINYLIEYDPQNLLLLLTLLQNIYRISERISIVEGTGIYDRHNAASFHNRFPILLKKYLINWMHYLKDYRKKRITYKKTNQYKYCNVPLEIKDQDVKFGTHPSNNIIVYFNQLRRTLNPKKYNNVLSDNVITTNNLMEFCYYISNVLVCISHDIIYAINNKIEKLNENYNDREKVAETSNNINYMIKRAFNDITDALTDLKSGMFVVNLGYFDKKLFNDNIEDHFQRIQYPICNCEQEFNELLENIESNISTQNLRKIQELTNKIRKYQDSNKFSEKLFKAIENDTQLNVQERYKKIKQYYENHRDKVDYLRFGDEVDYSILEKDGQINEKLVNEIVNKNIDIAKNILLNKLKNINFEIFYCYLSKYNNQDLYGEINNWFSSFILANDYYETSFNGAYSHFIWNIYGPDIYSNRTYTLIENAYFCYETYYKKYAQILWDDINKIVEEVFKE